MKPLPPTLALLLPLCFAAAPAAGPSAAAAAEPSAAAAAVHEDHEPASASLSLRLPESTREIEIRWRQVGTDLARWTEPAELDEPGLHRLRVQTLLALGGMIDSDVDLRFGDRRIRGGKHPFSFTVDQGGVMRFFVVDGTEALDLPSEALEVSFEAPHLTLALAHVARNELHLHWHLGRKAGRIVLRPGLGDADEARDRAGGDRREPGR